MIDALQRVMRDLPAIGKDQRAAEGQGGYAYRGIEQITREAQRLFAHHGVTFMPRVVAHDVVDIIVNQKPWTDTRLLVEYAVYGPGGAEDRVVVGPILGIGRDNTDKGANKAMTQAFKYALLQTLCISDAKDDNDGTTDEADQRYEGPPMMTRAQQERIIVLCNELKTGGVEWGTWPEVFGVTLFSAPDSAGKRLPLVTEERASQLIEELEDRIMRLPRNPADDTGPF